MPKLLHLSRSCYHPFLHLLPLHLLPLVSFSFLVCPVSVLTCLVLVVLVLSESVSILSLHTVEHVSVDPTFSQKLRISFNVTFHALRCGQVTLDAMDVAGDQQEPEEHEIWKRRVGRGGEGIGEAFRGYLPWEQQQMDRIAEEREVKEGYCGDCYGAKTEERPCCNTCEDVKDAYVARKWNAESVSKIAVQCMTDAAKNALSRHSGETAGEQGEGCNVFGFMLVHKVAGNLNVALGDVYVEGDQHIHQFNPSDLAKFNVSHTVHQLTFGPEVPELRSPLRGLLQSREEGAGAFHYYIKLVPTLFVSTPSFYWTGSANDVAAAVAAAEASTAVPSAPSTSTNQQQDSLPSGVALTRTTQYAVSTSWRPVQARGMRATVLPGVYFVYDLSPFMITVTQRRGEGILTFLTGLCAILGGLLTLSELLDRVVHKSGALRQIAADPAKLLNFLLPPTRTKTKGIL